MQKKGAEPRGGKGKQRNRTWAAPCPGVVRAAPRGCRSVSMAVRSTWVTSSASSSASSPGTWLEVRAALLGQGDYVLEDAIWGWGLGGRGNGTRDLGAGSVFETT